MADSKISDLTALTTQASNDLLPIVDVSEAAAADKNKRITIQELFRGIPVDVGIGTSSPTRLLSLVETGAETQISLISDTDRSCAIYLGDTDTDNRGFIQYDNVGDSLRIGSGGSEQVRIDSSGRVGIGTSSPGSFNAFANTLVVGSGSGTHGITIYSGNTDSGNLNFADGTSGTDAYPAYINYNHSNNKLQIFVNYAGSSDPRLVIDSSGNLGIGVTNPISELHVENSTQAHISVKTASSNMAKFGSKGNDVYIAGTSGSANVIFKRNVTSIDHPADSGTETLRIDSSGRLLLGTSTALANIKRYATSTAPQQQISTAVNSWSSGLGLVNYSGSGYAPVLTLGLSRSNTKGTNALVTSGNRLGVITFNGNDGTDFEEGGRIEVQADGTPSSTSMPGRLMFFTTAAGSVNPTERMRILSNGATKITTNGNFVATDRYHELYQSNNGFYTTLFNHAGTSAPYGIGIQFNAASPDNNTNTFIYCSDSTTSRFVVYSDGDVRNHDNSYGAISDEKLKQDIVDAGSQWDDLKNLRVRKFKFKSDVEAYGDEAKTLIGVVAQEVETVSPGLVKNNPDKDAENNDLGTTTKAVNYSVLYMKAVKALQEAMERIETLEAKVAALESA